MNWIQYMFGTGTNLTILQMTVRGMVVFIAALIMLRIAGKRTFGKNSATDTVIMILLGALLSRAVTGASPFLPVICSSFGIILLHRFLAWVSMYNKTMNKMVKGECISLYKNGAFHQANMKQCMISEADIMESVRLQTNNNSMGTIKEVIIEVNGHISVIEK